MGSTDGHQRLPDDPNSTEIDRGDKSCGCWKITSGVLVAFILGILGGVAFPKQVDKLGLALRGGNGSGSSFDAAALRKLEPHVQHFYMYRVQNDEDYSPENQNMANVAGALWYLHNEIVWHHWNRGGTYASTPKTRVERFLVATKATDHLIAKGMNFGVVNTYDLGQCTGPFHCENLQEYGPAVGCESWTKANDSSQGNNFPHEQWTGSNLYPNAMWYSLPGPCSSTKFWNQTGDCHKKEPSGVCPPGVTPTGAWDCTYSYKKVGEISINELEGIDSFPDFVKAGGREYDRAFDKGVNLDFWDHISDTKACQRRIDKVNQLFVKKYPDQLVLGDPVCDFDVNKFYPHFPNGTFQKEDNTARSKAVTH